MKYRDVISNELLNINDFEKYIIKQNIDKSIAIIEFSDNDISDILICYDKLIKLIHKFNCVGEDGYFYFITDENGGCIEKSDKAPARLIKTRWNYYKKFDKKLKSDLNTRKLELKSTSETKLIGCLTVNTHFSKCKFIDKEMSYFVPFRFKTAKSQNKPLLIYFSGAGTLGHHNMFPLLEFMPLYRKVKKYDCNIIIPQAAHGTNNGIEGIRKYNMCIVHLIEKLIETKSIDSNRIYIIGTSFGGGCVWQAICDYPKMFAAALPIMGTLLSVNHNDTKVFETIKDIPLWIAHSSDDTNVPIENDDYCFEKLKGIGANIKYTRWDKYGHSMSTKFYKNEPWADWIFEQSKS